MDLTPVLAPSDPLFGNIHHAQNILPTVQIHPDGNAHCLLYNLPFTADMVLMASRKTTA